MEIYTNSPNERLRQAKKKVKKMKGFYIHALVYVLVNGFLLLVYYTLIQQEFGNNTFVTPYLWGIGLAIHGFTVFGPDLILGNNWEAKEIQKILNK